VDKIDKENWGFKIRSLMKEKRWYQHELAEKSGLTREHISLIVTGHINSPKDYILKGLARAFGMTVQELRQKLYNLPALPSGKTEDWNRYSDAGFVKVPVYPDYVKAHAGEELNIIDYIYVKKPASLPSNIRAYRVDGDCMEPIYHNGDYVIVDHDRQIDPGDKVVCICDDQVHVAKLKVIAGEYWLENRLGTRKMTECKGIARIIGHYNMEA
jgi:transcriptional regulator with XRE-family HTH domain